MLEKYKFSSKYFVLLLKVELFELYAVVLLRKKEGDYLRVALASGPSGQFSLDCFFISYLSMTVLFHYCQQTHIAFVH